jgi:hypothetical protein
VASQFAFVSGGRYNSVIKERGNKMPDTLLNTLRQLSADSDIDVSLLAYDEALIRLIRSTTDYGSLLDYLNNNY